MAQWIEPDLDLKVELVDAGPYDPLDQGTRFDVTDRVRGRPGISISRGRSSELDAFAPGRCSFILRNSDRFFDPAWGGYVVLSGVGDTVTSPDHATLKILGDLDVRLRISMVDWTPGGFGQFVIGQWPNVAGNNAWVFLITATGFLQMRFTTDGTTSLDRTSTVANQFADGTDGWMRFTLDVDNGAGGHDVRFYTSTDGLAWNQLGATVTNAGTVTVFDSTASLAIGDILPLVGKLHQAEIRQGIDGALVADPDFRQLPVGTRSFTDSVGLVWTINGNGRIEKRSPYAGLLEPGKRVEVTATKGGVSRRLFTGFVEGWPQEWTNTTGHVPVEASDAMAVIAGDELSAGVTIGAFVLDSSQLDVDRLAGPFGPLESGTMLSGELVGQLASAAGFASAHLDVDAGVELVVGIDVDSNALEAITESARAESGWFYVAADGRLTFRGRHARFTNPRMTNVQAVITDGQYSGLRVDYDRTFLFNDARITRKLPPSDAQDASGLDVAPPDPVEQQSVNVDSVNRRGRRVHRDTLPLLTDTAAKEHANHIVDRFGVPRPRPQPVSMSMRKGPVFDKTIGLELLDRVQIDRTPLGIGPTESFVGLVQRIDDTITQDEWVRTMAIELDDPADPLSFMILDDTTRGRLDLYRLAY